MSTRSGIERVATNETMAAAASVLEELRTDPALLVMDAQTYYFLMPHFAREPEHRSFRQRPVLASFRWGESDVVVFSAFILRVGRRALGRPNHLHEFLRDADEILPELGLLTRSSGRLIFGGWRTRSYGEIGSLDRALAGDGERSVSGLQIAPGFGSARVNWKRYVELLDGAR